VQYNKRLLEEYNVKLTAANSINWGRLIAQIIYHISSYIKLIEQKVISLGDPIDIVIPSGNFGSMLGAFLAKQMGLPIRKLICASNTNNILTDFLKTGIFDIRERTLQQTPSPAMDILIPSNVERLLYFITQSTEQVGEWMKDLQEKNYFVVDEKTKQILQETFFADWVSNEETLKSIKEVYKETRIVIDPHTAVAVEISKRYQKKEYEQIPLVICSTAHWAKFPETIYQSLIDDKNNLDEFTMIKIIQKETGSSVPASLLDLKNKKILYTNKIPVLKQAIEEVIIDFFETHL
jgi:threonine synthase